MSAAPLIFICYAGPDRPIATRVHRVLDARGMRPWCDAVDLAPGERWGEAIPRMVKQAVAALVLVTDRWPVVGDDSAGWYGSEEVAVAIDHARRLDPCMAIVPARLDGVGPERCYGLRRLVGIVSSGPPTHRVCICPGPDNSACIAFASACGPAMGSRWR